MGWRRRRARPGKHQEGECPQRVSPQAGLERGPLRASLGEALSPVHGAILDPRLAQAANVAPRTAILRAAQQAVGNQALLRLLQARQLVSRPDDAYERDAERMAAAALHPSEAEVQRQGEEENARPGKRLSGQAAALAQRSQNKARGGAPASGRAVGRATSSMQPLPSQNNLAAQIVRQKGAGQPLDRETKQFMERGFGYGLDNVRVHTDSFAAQVTGDLGAEALAIGKDVFFRPGGYQPSTTSGRKLLAHELAHVVQCEGKGHRIGFWPFWVHTDFSRQVLSRSFPERLVNYLAPASGHMDFSAATAQVLFNWDVLGRMQPVEECPNHGEGGLYTETDWSAAAAINGARQDQYLRAAQGHLRAYENIVESHGTHGERVRELAHIRRDLGNALHVAQDRGSHGEGVRGQGHSQDRYDCDDPAQNGRGRDIALTYSNMILDDFLRAGRGIFGPAQQRVDEGETGRATA